MRVAPRCSCVAQLRRCARRIIQCFGRSVVFGTPVVVQQAVFVQWHVSVSYCGVIPLNSGSLEEAVVVLSFVLIPCRSLHGALEVATKYRGTPTPSKVVEFGCRRVAQTERRQRFLGVVRPW